MGGGNNPNARDGQSTKTAAAPPFNYPGAANEPLVLSPHLAARPVLRAVLSGCGARSRYRPTRMPVRTDPGGLHQPPEAYGKGSSPPPGYWREETGEEVRFEESYWAAGARAGHRGGFEADVAALYSRRMWKRCKAGLTNETGGRPHRGWSPIRRRDRGSRRQPQGHPRLDDLGQPGPTSYPHVAPAAGAMWMSGSMGRAARRDQAPRGTAAADPAGRVLC